MRSGSNEVLIDYANDSQCATKDYVEYVAGGVVKNVDYSGSTCSVETDTSIWVKSGNTLTEGTGEDAAVYTIEELSATTLQLSEVYTIQGTSGTYIKVYTRQ